MVYLSQKFKYILKILPTLQYENIDSQNKIWHCIRIFTYSYLISKNKNAKDLSGDNRSLDIKNF